MPEVAKILIPAVLGMLIATTGIVIGWVAGRQSLAPRLRGYDPQGPGEETVKILTSDPESAAVAADLASEPELPKDFGTGMWPVTEKARLNPLEDQTVPVSLKHRRVKPYRWPGPRHGAPEPIVREVDQLGIEVPFVTAEVPVLDWSSRTGELDGVSG